MKNNFMQQEVLVMLNSVFAQNQFDKINKNRAISKKNRLEEACVSGLQELLPVVFKSNLQKKMYLWQMHPGTSFVQFEFGEIPATIEKQYSLDPHNFLFESCYN